MIAMLESPKPAIQLEFVVKLLSNGGNRGYCAFEIDVRACGIAHRTPKRESLPYTTPTTPFLFIKLLRIHIKFNSLSFIVSIIFFKEYKSI